MLASRSLLPLRLWYLFYFAAQYTQLFLPLILSSVYRFSPTQIGVVLCTRRILTSIVSPVFTSILDRTHLHRPLLVFAHFSYYALTIIASFFRQFPLVLLLFSIREMSIGGAEPAINNAAMAKLEQIHLPAANFGYLRLYGSIGWGVAAVLGSYAVDHYFSGNLLVILYIQAAIGLAVTTVVAHFIDLSPALFDQQLRRHTHPSSLSMLKTLCSPTALFCALTVTMEGVVFGAVQLTGFIYFSSLGVSTTALGVSIFTAALIEVLVFLAVPRLLRDRGGEKMLLWMGMTLTVVLLIGMSCVHKLKHVTAWFIVSETLNGGTYAIFLAAAVALINQIAPGDTMSGAQGIMTGLLNGVGPGIGAAISGVVYERYGAPTLYIGLAIAQAAVMAVGGIIGGGQKQEIGSCPNMEVTLGKQCKVYDDDSSIGTGSDEDTKLLEALQNEVRTIAGQV